MKNEVKIKDGTIIELPKNLRLGFFDRFRIKKAKNTKEAANIIGKILIGQDLEKIPKEIKIDLKF